MFLDIINFDYDKDIIPFTKNGIIVDTSIIKIIIDGFISVRFSGRKISESPEYDNLLKIFDILKINNQWNFFLITPHILAEVCNHFRNQYNKRFDYKKIVEGFIPILKDMDEHIVSKSDIIKYVENKKPVIEIGDISIFITADDLIGNKKKISILAKDTRLCESYFAHPNVMVMDYASIIPNLSQI